MPKKDQPTPNCRSWTVAHTTEEPFEVRVNCELKDGHRGQHHGKTSIVQAWWPREK